VIALVVGAIKLALYFLVWRSHSTEIKSIESNAAANVQ
jgi:hypothetical protein